MRAIIKDKYVLAMEYLHEHPQDSLARHWACGEQETWHLFRTLPYCGCLTQIRESPKMEIQASDWLKNEAFSQLVREIAKDDRIPKDKNDIRPEHLNTFAYYQRRVDALGIRST